MVRFILRKSYKDPNNGDTGQRLFTFDADCLELEKLLTAGGFSESGFDYNELIGAEIINKPTPEADSASVPAQT